MENFAFEIQLNVLGYELQVRDQKVNDGVESREIRQNVDFKIGNSSTGKRYTTSSNRESDYELILAAFSITRVDIGYGFNWKKLQSRLGFSIENLFDVDYMMILWRPMPGRYYSLNLQFKWRK